MGFGTDKQGVEDFIASGSLLGDLGSQFVARWVGELITIGAAISAFGCALARIVGAAKLLFLSGERQVAAWEVVVPFLALVVIGYTLFRNVYPYPTDAAAWYLIIAALWVVTGILLTFVRYAATQRAGERLLAEEGLAAATGSRTEG